MSIHDTIRELDVENKKIKELNEVIDKHKDRQRSLSEEVLPELMDGMQLTHLKNKEYDVTVTTRYRPNLPKGSETRDKALLWLSENGFANALTYQVNVFFDDYESAKAYGETTPNSVVIRDIHHQTLEALINEQIELNPDFPIDLFNAYEQKRTKVDNL